MTVLIRALLYDDAAAYTDLLRILAVESKYPVVNLIEKGMTAADWRAQIKDMVYEPHRAIFVVAEGDELVGFLSVNPGGMGIDEGRIVIGLREHYTGRKLGTRLFELMELWARAAGLRRLFLTVEHTNQRALGLYLKLGYETVGLIPNATRIENQWVDDYVMEKWLSTE